MSSTPIVRRVAPEAAATYIAGLVNGALAGGRSVLLLLPGGSSIAIAAAAYRLCTAAHRDRVKMVLTDERYGEPGHADSNWTQLAAAGLPVLQNDQAIPVLTGLSLEETTARFDTVLREQFAKADVVIGLFGMGTDGHTAGIIPGTPAVTAETWAAGYQGTDFTRITMTFAAIRQIDVAVLTAYGEAKRTQLQALQQEQPLAIQPAQILKTVPTLAVFADSLGEPL